MKYDFDTKFGKVTVADIIMDIDGTNLEEGISIKYTEDNALICEVFGYSASPTIIYNGVLESIIETHGEI